MIAEYLFLLYKNAPVFRNSAVAEHELTFFFRKETDTALQSLSLPDERALIEYLISTDYSNLKTTFGKFPFLEIFYLVNSLGEYRPAKDAFDEVGRLKFERSVQFQTGIENNSVLQKLIETHKSYPFLNSGLKLSHHKSYFFLSHDIDSLYGSTLQDGLWAVKKGRVDVALKVLFNTLMQKPEWFNIDLIMKTESAYDFKSTFYWLVNKGKVDKRQTNSDYSIAGKKVVKAIEDVKAGGFENGLHKSISADTFAQELKKAPFKSIGNRYHYLKFSLPSAYKDIKAAGLKVDASLGFAEHYGFRNNYGYPFHPFDMETQSPYSFLEIPLNVMDGTLQRYMKIPVGETAKTVINFLEKNNTDALLSILWHNTFFTNYKYRGYLDEYKKILAYLYEAKFENLNQSQIFETFSWKG